MLCARTSKGRLFQRPVGCTKKFLIAEWLQQEVDGIDPKSVDSKMIEGCGEYDHRRILQHLLIKHCRQLKPIGVRHFNIQKEKVYRIRMECLKSIGYAIAAA